MQAHVFAFALISVYLRIRLCGAPDDGTVSRHLRRQPWSLTHHKPVPTRQVRHLFTLIARDHWDTD